MDTILLGIQKQLDKVAKIAYKDENWGQLDLYGNDCPVKWPCALIDIQSANFSNLGTNIRALPINRQEGLVTVEISLAILKLTNSSRNAPFTQKLQAFEIYALAKEVHQVLHGWSPLEASTGMMIRTGMSKVRRDDGIQELRIIYTFGLHDC